MKTLTLVVYDILNGGTGRADPLVEVIAAQRADVAVLLEAGDPDVVHRLAWRLGMEPLAIGDGKEEGGPIAVLSRLPIERSANLGLLRRTGFPCGEVVVGGVRLVALNGATGAAAQAVAGEVDGRHVVAGGFVSAPDAAGYAVAEPGGYTAPTTAPAHRAEQVLSWGYPIVSARVETDRLATYASDHYPVVVSLNVE